MAEDDEREMLAMNLPIGFGSRSSSRGYIRRNDLDKEKKICQMIEKKRKEGELKTRTKWVIIEEDINELSISYAPSFEAEAGERRKDLLEKIPSSGLVVHALFPSILVSVQDTESDEKKGLLIKKVNPQLEYNISDQPCCMPLDVMSGEVYDEAQRIWFPLKDNVPFSAFFDKIWYKHASAKKFPGNYLEETLNISRSIVSEEGLTRFLEQREYRLNNAYTCSELFEDVTEYFGVPVKVIFGGERNSWRGINIIYNKDLSSRLSYPSLPEYGNFGSFTYESIGFHEQTARKTTYEKRPRELIANQGISWHLRETNWKNPIVFFDIEIDGHPVGRIHMELFDDIAPYVSGLFRKFCSGTVSSVGFKGSHFPRVIKEFMVYSGIFVQVDDSFLSSTYGRHNRIDSVASHTGPGLLSLSLAPNANGYQFFITCGECHWLDDDNLVVGRVVDGMEILKVIERVDVWPDDCPENDCVIASRGELIL